MVWEDIYQVYRVVYKDDVLLGRDLIASDMSIYDAILFMRVWMQENYNDQITSLELCRQPMDYGKNYEYNQKCIEASN